MRNNETNVNYIGIDPGIHGAVAVLSCDYMPFVYDSPNFCVERNGRKNFATDVEGVVDILKQIKELVIPVGIRPGVTALRAVIEHVGPRPGEGVVSVGKLMFNYGVWHAALTALRIPYTRVEPRKWKSDMGVTAVKKSSLVKARILFPSLEAELKRAMDHNRAEALLLASWLREQE